MNRQEFLSNWFQDCEGNIEIRLLPSKQQRFFSVEDPQRLDSFVSKHSNENVYLGCASRNGHGGTKADIINIPGAWADIDFKNVPKEQADKLLKECPLPPTFIIQSGGGYHCYWRFREPTDNIQIVEHINQQLAQFFESDPAVCDASHILRLPDTFNHKYEPKRPVKIQVCNQDRQYNESDFEEQLPPLKNEANNSKSTNQQGWQDELLKGVDKGQRNQTAARLAGRFLTKGLSQLEVLTSLEGWNLKNKPPLGNEELKGIIDSVDKTDKRNHPPQEDPSKFPDDIMSGIAGEFAKLYGKYLEPPEHFFYMAFLVCLGSVLARTVKFRSELDTQIRVYLLILGESADDRKSTALIKTLGFFKDTVEDFIFYLAVNSAEGLQKLFKRSKNILLCFDEFKTFMDKCKIETSVLLTCVNSLFEQNYTSAHTKSSDIEIDDAYLSLLAASTLDTYERVWGASSLAIGFQNRIWIVPGTAKRKKAFPDPMPLDEKKKIKKDLVKILSFVGEGLELGITPEAEEIFQDWYENLERSMHSKRLEGYALRFMGLLAINELKDQIDAEIVKKALRLCNWQLEVRQLFDPIDADNKIAEIEERIRRHLKGEPLTERGLKRKLHRTIERGGVWVFTTALKNLREAREIYYKKEERGIYIYLNA